MKKRVCIVWLCLLCCLSFWGCRDNSSLRFTAPEGTPALAVLRLPTDHTEIGQKKVSYEIVSAANVAAEMSSGKSDLVILPVNAGANLIRQGADYKCVSIAVRGSLYLVSKQASPLALNDLKGKTVACIGKTGVPALVFQYILRENGIGFVTEGTATSEQVLIQFVSDANMARTFDYAVVGEPAATVFQTKFGFSSEVNLQNEYALCSGESTYPQAGLFVKTSLSNDQRFMTELFACLEENKNWITDHPDEVNDFARENLYESASFPAPSVPRCETDGSMLTEETKNQIVSFLKNVFPKDSQGNVIDWDSEKTKLF